MGKTGKRYRACVVLLFACMSFGPLGRYALRVVFPSMGVTSHLAGGSRSAISKEEVLADPIGVLLDAEKREGLKDAVILRVENFFPYRDDLMLLHAKLQRTSIAGSARVAGYEAFPSFYGSDFVCVPELSCVAPMLLSGRDMDDGAIGGALDAYAGIVRRHPDITWVFYPADSAETSEANPTAGLVSDPETYDCCYRAMRDGLPASAAVIYDPCESLDELYRTRYRTDHHWNIDGAIEGFARISEALGMGDVELGERVVASYDEFFGSYARRSLCLDYPDDGVEDVAFDMGGLRVRINGENVDVSALDYAVKGTYEKAYEVDNLYGSCFHGDFGLIEIVNDAVDEGTLLIVGDSYSNPMERFFASGYHRVVVCDPRWCADSLEEVIGTYAPDAVVSIQMAHGFFAEERIQGILHGYQSEG